MRIVLRSGNTAATYEIADIVGEFSSWTPGVARDVPDDAVLTFVARYPEGERREARNAVQAILSAGPIFVDADTGLNPDFVCSKCGVESADESFLDRRSGSQLRYADASGKRLCIACFLDANPHHEASHAYGGYVRPQHAVASEPAPAPVAAPEPEVFVAPNYVGE